MVKDSVTSALCFYKVLGLKKLGNLLGFLVAFCLSVTSLYAQTSQEVGSVYVAGESELYGTFDNAEVIYQTKATTTLHKKQESPAHLKQKLTKPRLITKKKISEPKPEAKPRVLYIPSPKSTEVFGVGDAQASKSTPTQPMPKLMPATMQVPMAFAEEAEAEKPIVVLGHLRLKLIKLRNKSPPYGVAC